MTATEQVILAISWEILSWGIFLWGCFTAYDLFEKVTDEWLERRLAAEEEERQRYDPDRAGMEMVDRWFAELDVHENCRCVLPPEGEASS